MAEQCARESNGNTAQGILASNCDDNEPIEVPREDVEMRSEEEEELLEAEVPKARFNSKNPSSREKSFWTQQKLAHCLCRGS